MVYRRPEYGGAAGGGGSFRVVTPAMSYPQLNLTLPVQSNSCEIKANILSHVSVSCSARVVLDSDFFRVDSNMTHVTIQVIQL